MTPLGLPFAARVALMIASGVLGVVIPGPRTHRDNSGVRGLACLLMRETGASWPEVSGAVYGHRHGHSSAVTGAARWRDTQDGDKALAEFRRLLLKDSDS